MEMIPDKNLPRQSTSEPAILKVQPGKIYSWCSCGLTEASPFCDNAHRNIEHEPYRSIKVVFDKEEEIRFCQCKKTKTPPFCDDTHKSLKKK
jgi:CDGSH-type Zn-finger protein